MEFREKSIIGEKMELRWAWSWFLKHWSACYSGANVCMIMIATVELRLKIDGAERLRLTWSRLMEWYSIGKHDHGC